jgi:hypothetical protein
MPLIKMAKSGVQEILEEVFCLSPVDVREGSICFNMWLAADEIQLPFSSSLSFSSNYYWNHLIFEKNGWKFLARIALLFGNTLPSESSVERDFS